MRTIALDENTTEKNNMIAHFMGGYVIKQREYDMPHGSQSTHIINMWMKPMGAPNWATFAHIGHFEYHSSWDWLMPVIRKINGLGKEYQFTIFKTYVSCTVERGGKFYKDFSFSHAEYITEEQSDITAAYNLVVKFIEWYNQINNEIQNENKEST